LNRYLARGAYVVAFALIVIPMFDAATSVLPLRFGESRWRYGTIGLLSNSLLIPMAGVLVAFAIANAYGHRKTLRTLGGISALSAVMCLAAIVTFALDALQSQSGIVPAAHQAYIVASSTAAIKLLLGAIAFTFFALAGLKRLPSGAGKGAPRDRILVTDANMKREKPAKASV
jgi:hypothetical protein